MNSWPSLEQPPLAGHFKFKELSIFDSASKSCKSFLPKKTRQMYVCGITPYDATHLGHAATYLTFDLINRYWQAQGSDVNYIQNITDIDDPLLERANRDGVHWQELALSQIDLFRSDMVALRIHPPKTYAGAIDEIPEVIRCIEKLEKVSATYPVQADTYFDIQTDSKFGSRSNLTNVEQLKLFAERGGDPERLGKRNKLDTLLWLAHRNNEPEWSSPFGNGRPGWHIECAAIALKYAVADSDYVLDIQGGGKDLIFPHHEMSASQVEVLTNKALAFSYVHAGLIGLDGEKMSKSKGNLLFVSQLISSGINPMVIRLALLDRNFAEDTMWNISKFQDAQLRLEAWKMAMARMETPETDSVIIEIINALANNLDSKTAINAIDKWAQSSKFDQNGNPGELSRAIDALLGIAI